MYKRQCRDLPGRPDLVALLSVPTRHIVSGRVGLVIRGRLCPDLRHPRADMWGHQKVELLLLLPIVPTRPDLELGIGTFAL